MRSWWRGPEDGGQKTILGEWHNRLQLKQNKYKETMLLAYNKAKHAAQELLAVLSLFGGFSSIHIGPPSVSYIDPGYSSSFQSQGPTFVTSRVGFHWRGACAGIRGPLACT